MVNATLKFSISVDLIWREDANYLMCNFNHTYLHFLSIQTVRGINVIHLYYIFFSFLLILLKRDNEVGIGHLAILVLKKVY